MSRFGTGARGIPSHGAHVILSAAKDLFEFYNSALGTKKGVQTYKRSFGKRFRMTFLQSNRSACFNPPLSYSAPTPCPTTSINSPTASIITLTFSATYFVSISFARSLSPPSINRFPSVAASYADTIISS